MTKTKSTKRALLTSAISLLLCVSMLIGSTFAWFTDSASTGVNTILAGNLDIKLSYKNAADTDYSEIEADTKDLFVNKNGDAMLWEPGAISVCYFKLENLGTLALEYDMAVIANDVVKYNGNGLSGALKSAVVELTAGETLDNAAAIEKAMAANAESVLTYKKHDTMLGKNTTGYEDKYFAMVIYMPTETDNTYNVPAGQPALQTDLFISLQATQLNSESDSFGPDYDKDAENAVLVTNQEELDDAVADAEGPVVAQLSSGTYILNNTSYGDKNMTFKGESGVIMDLTGMGNEFYSDRVTFENMTVIFPDVSHKGLTHSNKIVFNNCTLRGTQTLYASTVEFNNCTFEGNDGKDIYYVWTYGIANAIFNNCTFNTNGKAILCYTEGAVEANVTLNNCKFISDGTVANDKAAVEVGTDNHTQKFTLTFTECTTDGFVENPKGTPTGSPLWGNKNSMTTDELNVIIDGKDVY